MEADGDDGVQSSRDLSGPGSPAPQLRLPHLCWRWLGPSEELSAFTFTTGLSAALSEPPNYYYPENCTNYYMPR